MPFSLRALVVSAFAFASLPAVAQALTVAPMQVEMVSSGSRSRATVTVVNNSDQPMPIEAVVQRMSLDESGKAQTVRSDEEFLIMPPQAMIPPGATQNFRIQWLGEPMLDTSQSFYVYFNQVPVKLPQGKAALQVVMSMGVMVNVAPPQGMSDLKVVGTGVVNGKDGKRYPVVTVQNPGRIHALLPQATLKLSSGGWSETLSAGQLSESLGSGLVQPGKRRRFVLPIALPQGVSSLQASLEMNARR